MGRNWRADLLATKAPSHEKHDLKTLRTSGRACIFEFFGDRARRFEKRSDGSGEFAASRSRILVTIVGKSAARRDQDFPELPTIPDE
jgi:hypothetical protein